MYTINLDSIKNYKEKINSEKRNFNSQAYNTFRSSYLNNCSESIVRKMSSQLNKKYDKIKTGYSNISTWMNDYTSNALSIESYLSGSGGGGIQDSGLRNFALSNLVMPDANYASNSIFGGMNLVSDYAKTMVGVQSGIMDLVKSSTISSAANVGKLANSAISSLIKTGKKFDFTGNMSNAQALILGYLGMSSSTLYESGATVVSSIKSKAKDVIDVAKNFDYLGFVKEVGHNIVTIGKRTGATIGTVATSAVEGLFTLGDNIMTGAKIGADWIVSEGFYLFGAIDKKTRDSGREELKKQIEKDGNFWKKEFDYFYDNNLAGKFLKNNTYGFDTSREIGTSLGEIAGIIAIGVATGGAGAGVASGGAASTAGGLLAGSTNVGAMSATAFSSSFGKSTRDAWLDGADYSKGLKYGTARGAWDAAQWYIGGKMNEFNKFANAFANAGTRVASDAGLGFFETPAEAAFKSIYRDGYTDTNGKFVKFDKNMTWKEKYEKLYKEAGGTKAAVTNALFATVLSGGAEAINIRGGYKALSETGDDGLKRLLKFSGESDEAIEKILKKSKGTKLYAFENAQQNIINKFTKEGYSKIEIDNILNNLKGNVDVTSIYSEKSTNDRGINNSDIVIKIDDSNFNSDNYSIIRKNISDYKKSIREYSDYTIDKHPEWNISKDEYYLIALNEAKDGNYGCISREYRNKFKDDYKLLNMNLDKEQIYNDKLKRALMKAGYSAGEANYVISNDIDSAFRIFNDINNVKTQADVNINNSFRQEKIDNDDWFESLRGGTGSYGVDQGIIDKLYWYENKVTHKRISAYELNGMTASQKKNYAKVGSDEYFRLKNKYKSQGFSSNDISRIMSGLDSEGACSYANISNEIFNSYKYAPDEFKKVFGFDMFVDIDGKKTLNSSELILDMYINVNDVKNGGKLIKNNKVLTTTDNVDIYGRHLLDANDQQFLSSGAGIKKEIVDNYLKTKNSSLCFNSYNLINNSQKMGNISLPEMKKYSKAVQDCIDSGEQCHLGIYSKGSEISMHSLDTGKIQTTKNWNEGGGHAVYVTSTSDQGFIVSSWGEKWLIPYDSLTDNASFVITVSRITKKI